MHYPEDAKALALSEAYLALLKTLYEAGVIKAEPFLANIEGAATALARNGEVIAAHALRDMLEPAAEAMGFVSRPEDE